MYILGIAPDVMEKSKESSNNTNKPFRGVRGTASLSYLII
jgi:hypothetical protein